jgi:hypothetical protein
MKLGFAVLLVCVLDADIEPHPHPANATHVTPIWPPAGPLVFPPLLRLADGPEFEVFADDFWQRMVLARPSA